MTDFIWTTQPEPHLSRRKAILAAHPEVKELMKHEPLTKYIMISLVILQICMGLYMKNVPFFSVKYFLLTYTIGATATHALFLGIHEVSHMLAFKNYTYNRILNIIANLPVVIPYSVAFKGYHTNHHIHQGEDGLDTDVPSRIEARFITSTPTKLLFCTNQILFYALRPMFIYQQTITGWHLINWTCVLGFDALVVYNFGWGPIWYWLFSDYLAGSLHPCAAHFIAEHYVFPTGDPPGDPVETYSYYGWLNMLCFNVGYHNEHHDFPNIPWSGLPKLRKIAHEFYDDLPCYKNWPLVIWNFIFDPRVTCASRVKRSGSN